MANDTEDNAVFLEQFDQSLSRYFDGEYGPEGRPQLRKSINESAPRARELLVEAGCYKRMSAAPPPMVGGPVLKNVDPFDMLFESYYGVSFIPNVRDMIQKAIGVYRAGGPVRGPEPAKEEDVIYKQLELPEPVTLSWLVHHVPVKFWLAAAGLLVAAFSAGAKATEWEFVRAVFGL